MVSCDRHVVLQKRLCMTWGHVAGRRLTQGRASARKMWLHDDDLCLRIRALFQPTMKVRKKEIVVNHRQIYEGHRLLPTDWRQTREKGTGAERRRKST
jgi:hypothetical protein